MYKIIGGDGKEYGPISAEQILRWLREGRVDARSRALREGTMDWRPIGEFPELMSTPDVAAQTDGKAVASLVCGILGLLPCVSIIAGVPAIILGHISRSAIRKSLGRLKGEGMALAGLIMGYVSLAMIPIVLIIATIAIPSLLRARQTANESAAVANLRTINTAEVTYLSTSGGNYGNLEQLIEAGLLDRRFHTSVSGYTFRIVADGGEYTAQALPASANTGRFAFYSTPDGVVRYSLEPNLAPPGQIGMPVQ